MAHLFLTTPKGQSIRNGYIDEMEMALKLIEKTGYSEQELAKVEYAFETSTKIEGCDYKNFYKDQIIEDQFNGLMAVVDVLCEIEGYNSTEYKKMFEYNEEFKPINVSL